MRHNISFFCPLLPRLNNTPYGIVMLERKSCTKETYRRTKETFTICFELQSLSALLDVHMMIITSIEEDCSARGSIPVTTKVPTRPKQEGTSDTNMWKGHHQTTTGERCNLRLPAACMQGTFGSIQWGKPSLHHLSSLGKPRAEPTMLPHTATFGSILIRHLAPALLLVSMPLLSSSSFFLFFLF